MEERLTIRGFNFNSDFVASNLQSWPIAQALAKLQRLEDAAEDKELHPTVFDHLTASPAAMGAFLRTIPVLTGPWDAAFHRRFCDNCPAENCDACPNEAERDNPEWWLGLEMDPIQSEGRAAQKDTTPTGV